MEKIIHYLTHNYATVVGLTILTGLTVTSSALGATRIANNIRVDEPKPAIVRSIAESEDEKTPSPTEGTTRTEFIARSNSVKTNNASVSPTKTPSPTNGPTLSPTPKPTGTNNQCIVTLFGKQYDVTPLITGHPGGNVFTCGTDMTAIYQGQHGTDVSRMQKYLVVDGNPATTPTVTGAPASGSKESDEDYENENEVNEVEKNTLEKERETAKQQAERAYEQKTKLPEPDEDY